MENLEKPLTWVLVIVLLGYLFTTNIGSENDSSFTIKDLKMDSIEIIDTPAGEKKCVKIEDDSLNVDSIIDAVLEDIDMKIDTLIEIELEKDSLCFTYCQIPIIYKLSDKQGVKVIFNKDAVLEFDSLYLDSQTSKKVFKRTGEINRIEVFLKK